MYHINFKLAIQEKGYIPTICSIYLFVIFLKGSVHQICD